MSPLSHLDSSSSASNSSLSASMDGSNQKRGIMRVRTLKESLSSIYDEKECFAASAGGDEDGRLLSDTARTRTKPLCSVSFKQIVIREYGQVIGDNPSCSGGAPISLDWLYSPKHIQISVDTYEKALQERGPRSNSELRMPAYVRHRILSEWDVSMSQILRAAAETDCVRKGRSKTAKHALKQLRSQERLREVGSVLKKIFNIKKRLDKLKRKNTSSKLGREFRNNCGRRSGQEDLETFSKSTSGSLPEGTDENKSAYESGCFDMDSSMHRYSLE